MLLMRNFYSKGRYLRQSLKLTRREIEIVLGFHPPATYLHRILQKSFPFLFPFLAADSPSSWKVIICHDAENFLVSPRQVERIEYNHANWLEKKSLKMKFQRWFFEATFPLTRGLFPNDSRRRHALRLAMQSDVLVSLDADVRRLDDPSRRYWKPERTALDKPVA